SQHSPLLKRPNDFDQPLAAEPGSLDTLGHGPRPANWLLARSALSDPLKEPADPIFLGRESHHHPFGIVLDGSLPSPHCLVIRQADRPAGAAPIPVLPNASQQML